MKSIIRLVAAAWTPACVILLGSCAGASPGNAVRSSKYRQNFAAWDVNRDGRLSYAEFSNSIVAKKAFAPKKLFSNMDADGDGGVTQEELREYQRRLKANNKAS